MKEKLTTPVQYDNILQLSRLLRKIFRSEILNIFPCSGVFNRQPPANAFRSFRLFLPCHLSKLNIFAGEHFDFYPGLNIAAMELNNILSKVSACSRENNYGK